MALGTPVIASRVAGIPEALDDGRCGVLTPPRDIGALADAIATLLGDPALRRTLADRARRRTEEQFDMVRNGARLAELLQRAAAAEWERDRARATLDVLRLVQAACVRHRIAWMAPKVLQRYPDVGDDLDLLVFTSDVAIDRLVLEDVPVTCERPSFANRLSGSTVYTVAGAMASGLVLDVHHGRVGPAGQPAAFARRLAR